MVGAALPGMRRVEHVMGMPIVIDLRDDDAAEDLLDRAFDEFRAVDERFSTYKRDQRDHAINRGELALARCACRRARDPLALRRPAPRDAGLLRRARSRRSGSSTPPGLVKGWSVERVADLLAECEARNFAINAGGDVIVRGRGIPDDCWRVGIQHPAIGDKVAAVVVASDLAIATSGAYARGDHIIDPHTGLPPAGVLSVTITGPSLATADAYATAAFAMGAAGPAWTARLRGYEAMTILADGRVLKTPGFRSS